jgi:hypothetical protein
MVSRIRGRPLNAPATFILALAVASTLGISFCPTDALARRTRAAGADCVPSWDQTAHCGGQADLMRRALHPKIKGEIWTF